METVDNLGISPKKFIYGRFIMELDTSSGVKTIYGQAPFVPNDSYLKLPKNESK
jgi:hypothetical protein